ncbi:MAG: ParB/RepB/Spo0J family partition protein [Terriglobales bacterium]
MPSTSNAAATPDKAGMDNKAHEKADKVHEKVVEKRRALGRGLESLLPGPRVVAPPVSAPVAPSASVVDLQAAGIEDGAASGESPQAARPSTAAHGLTTGETVPGLPVADGIAAGRAFSELRGDGFDVVRVAIDLIDENPHQTRMRFDEAALKELGQSIRVQGVLQPIVVRPFGEGRFRLILGDRRLRASRLAGIETIPAIVKRVSEQQAAEMTVVENLQRQDLNCVEQANAFSNLSKDFNLTQEEIGSRVGMSREAVSNYMRLLTLPEGVQEALIGGKLTFSHAKTLLRLTDHAQIWTFAQRAIEERFSVADLEDLVKGVSVPHTYPRVAKGGGARWVDPNVKAAQRSLEEVLGMRVRIRDRRGRGKIVIEYATIDDFERVLGMLRGK